MSRRILVTGAGGFIGGRVAEVLHALGHDVRAGVRRWSSAARVGRLPVDIVACDVADAGQVAVAVQGVDVVIHCAVGDRDVTTRGTRNVLEASRAAGVRRVVHLSTIDVYGADAGEMHEGVAPAVTGREYGDSKIEAEALCREFVAQGLEVVILRPTIVYGPFSNIWTVEFAQRFQQGAWTVPPDDCAGVCNLVYIDDLVAAIIRAMSSEAAVGEAFNINGADTPTWQEYFDRLNAAIGLAPLAAPARRRAHLSAAVMLPVRRGAKLALKHFARPIQFLYQRSAMAKRLMRWAEQRIRMTPTPAEFTLYSRTATYPIAKAEQLLGYRPAFPVEEGIRLSVEWMRHEGIVEMRS